MAAKEAVNENDETRKRFEIMCREVFKKFKACLTVEGVNAYRHDYDAINIVYKSLQQDREQADITDIIRGCMRWSTKPSTRQARWRPRSGTPYDISKIDFDRLRKEFERSPAKHTTVQNLKQVIEERLPAAARTEPAAHRLPASL